MRRWWPLPVFVVLVFGAGWSATTVVVAVTDGDGHGGVFWMAIGLITILSVVLIWTACRVGRRLWMIVTRRSASAP